MTVDFVLFSTQKKHQGLPWGGYGDSKMMFVSARSRSINSDSEPKKSTSIRKPEGIYCMDAHVCCK